MLDSDIEILAKVELSNAEYRVFLRLFALERAWARKYGYGFAIVVPVETVARELNLSPETISHALDELCKRSVLTECKMVENNRSFCLNYKLDPIIVASKQDPMIVVGNDEEKSESNVVKFEQPKKKTGAKRGRPKKNADVQPQA